MHALDAWADYSSQSAIHVGNTVCYRSGEDRGSSLSRWAGNFLG